jgi:hypothetical protein
MRIIGCYAEPVGGAILLGEQKSRSDSVVAAEEVAEKIGTIALAAAVEQDNVPGQRQAAAAGAVEDSPDAGEGLAVGKMAAPAHDALLEEPGAVAALLHVGVVVAFDGQDIDAAELMDEIFIDTAEIGGITNPAGGTFDQKSVRAMLIVLEADGIHADAVDGSEGFAVERADEAGELIVCGEAGEVVRAIFVTMDADLAADDLADPVAIEMIAIKVGEADGGDLGEGEIQLFHSPGGDSRADAAVDEHGGGLSAEDGAIAGRPAGQDAKG